MIIDLYFAVLFIFTKNIMTVFKRLTCGILFLFLYGFYGHTFAQGISQKLPATHIIGVESVDYNTGNPSTTENTCRNAFDGDLNSFFASYQRSGGWVGLDLGEKHIITKVAYCPRQGWSNRLFLAVIEGANNPDFGDAIPLYMITQIPPENKMTEQTVNCSRGFRYVRYVGPDDQRCNIAELEFYGYAGNGNDSKLYQTTNLPDIIIHTTNAADIVSQKEYVKGIVSIISGNGTKIYSDSLEIRGRGNASWGFPKKPYRMKLYQKTNVLGLPANERNWTLINNYGDKTLMRNLLAFDLSRRFQMPYTPAGVPVNVYLNGDFKGCYQLCDHIEVAPGRVDIPKMKPYDTQLPALSGGYCIAIDAYYYTEGLSFVSNFGIPISFKYPKKDEIAPEQFNYIRSHFNLMEASFSETNYKDPVKGYRRYLDLETFIRFFLIGEFSGDTDTFWQAYLIKKRNDDKFYFGPVWDFDLAYENDNRTYPINNNPNWISLSTGSLPAGHIIFMINRMFEDEDFVKQMKSIYAYYRDQNIISEEALHAVIDRYANEIEESQILNFKRWDILKIAVHQNPRDWGSYSAEVGNVKTYTRARINWMDKKLGYTPPKKIDEPPKPTAIEEIYFKDVIVKAYFGSIHIEGIDAFTLVEVFDISGKRFYSGAVYNDTSIPLHQGIYLVRLTNRQGNTKVVKCRLE